MTEDRLLTLREVSERLHVTPRTVQRLVEAGRLPVVRISRKITRFRASDVETFIESNRAMGKGTENEA